MKTMEQLKNEGKIIIFITHKLREIKEVADVVTVIRRGKVINTVSPTETQEKLAELMVGRAVILNVQKDPQKYDEIALKVENLTLIDENGNPSLGGVSFDVKKGEILSIAGVQGNGQTELAEALLGIVKTNGGKITLGNTDLTGKTVKQTLDAGVGYIPEDRTTDGLVGEFTLPENLVLDQSDRPPFAKGLNLELRAINEHAKKLIKEFDVRSGSENSTASQLSGGNQQKVVVARELSRDLKLLVASQPTRGVDVGSIEFIHRQIVETRDKGIPVVVISTELDEVSALADRIAVMFKGKIIGIVDGKTDRNILGLMMAGVPQEKAEVKGEKE
jgi:simple sugar transport system ATP-binding protein